MPSSTPIAAKKRQHIIETAYRLFRRDGFHATGIDRIIAEADVAKMTMYRHFPGKDGLIVEVLDWRARHFDEQLDRLEAAAATPEQKIATIFDWHQRWFDSADFHGCLFQHALAEFGDRRSSGFRGGWTAEVRPEGSHRRHPVGCLAWGSGGKRGRRAVHADRRRDAAGPDGTGQGGHGGGAQGSH